jgi:hypothetical protein
MVLPIKFLGTQVAKRPCIVAFQEALANVVKHAKARNVWIRVRGENYMLFCSPGTTAESLILARYVQHLAGRD